MLSTVSPALFYCFKCHVSQQLAHQTELIGCVAGWVMMQFLSTQLLQ